MSRFCNIGQHPETGVGGLWLKREGGGIEPRRSPSHFGFLDTSPAHQVPTLQPQPCSPAIEWALMQPSRSEPAFCVVERDTRVLHGGEEG
jgi:hypothetical protein